MPQIDQKIPIQEGLDPQSIGKGYMKRKATYIPPFLGLL